MTAENGRTFIYCLCEPRSGEIRYVGKADDPERRFKKHLCNGENCHRTAWIRSLAADDIQPALILLEECPKENWQERERHWIAFLRENGADLVNSTDGGDGQSPGYVPTQATRIKVGISLMGNINGLGYKHTDTAKIKIGKASTGNIYAKGSHNNKGKVHTDEQNEAHRSFMKGKTFGKFARGKHANRWSVARRIAEEKRQKVTP